MTFERELAGNATQMSNSLHLIQKVASVPFDSGICSRRRCRQMQMPEPDHWFEGISGLWKMPAWGGLRNVHSSR
jgi:hypothetical protein